MKRFLRELRRRNVYRVALAYAAVTFVALQVVTLLVPATTLPPWADELLVALAVLGFPIALVVAWAFELTPEGLVRTAADEVGDPPAGSVDAGTAPGRGPGWRPRIGAVIGLALLAAAAGGWYVLRGAGEPEVTDRSIAVLPFETLGRQETTAFTDGVHGDILTRLSRIPDLSVISRASVMQYRNPGRPLPEIARQLGVAWVLQGEVQESGGQVQVNARLVRADRDRQVWAESYRRELTARNLFDIQSELTDRIARRLQAELSPAGLSAASRVPTENLEAYRLYVRGRSRLERWTGRDIGQAVTYFRQAIDLDPDYALAWAGLSDALSLLRWYGFPLPADASAPAEAASRALELGPQLAEAHASRAIVLSSRVPADAPEALRELEEAVRLRPSYAYAYIWMAWLHLLVGTPDAALAPAERAVELDPLDPAARVFLAESYLANGRAEAALRAAARGRELQPEKPLAHLMEALALHHLGRVPEAEAALESALSLVPPEGRTPSRSQLEGLLVVSRAAAGDTAGARAMLAAIGDGDGDPFFVGLAHAALGQEDAAFGAFREVRDWGQLATVSLRYLFPEVLGPLRQRAAYRDLLRGADRSWGVGSEGAAAQASRLPAPTPPGRGPTAR